MDDETRRNLPSHLAFVAMSWDPAINAAVREAVRVEEEIAWGSSICGRDIREEAIALSQQTRLTVRQAVGVLVDRKLSENAMSFAETIADVARLLEDLSDT